MNPSPNTPHIPSSPIKEALVTSAASFTIDSILSPSEIQEMHTPSASGSSRSYQVDVHIPQTNGTYKHIDAHTTSTNGTHTPIDVLTPSTKGKYTPIEVYSPSRNGTYKNNSTDGSSKIDVDVHDSSENEPKIVSARSLLDIKTENSPFRGSPIRLSGSCSPRDLFQAKLKKQMLLDHKDNGESSSSRFNVLPYSKSSSLDYDMSFPLSKGVPRLRPYPKMNYPSSSRSYEEDTYEDFGSDDDVFVHRNGSAGFQSSYLKARSSLLKPIKPAYRSSYFRSYIPKLSLNSNMDTDIKCTSKRSPACKCPHCLYPSLPLSPTRFPRYSSTPKRDYLSPRSDDTDRSDLMQPMMKYRRNSDLHLSLNDDCSECMSSHIHKNFNSSILGKSFNTFFLSLHHKCL